MIDTAEYSFHFYKNVANVTLLKAFHNTYVLMNGGRRNSWDGVGASQLVQARERGGSLGTYQLSTDLAALLAVKS